MLNIAYLLPNLDPGGTERHVLSLARLLDRSRFAPSLVTTAGGGTLFRDFSGLLPVTVTGGDPDRSRRFRASPFGQIRTVRALARIFRRIRPDILHAYLPATNVTGPVAARIAGVSCVIVSKRALAHYKDGFPLLRRVEPLGNRLANVVLVNSDAVRRDVERTERHWEGKFRKVYNGVAPLDPWPAGEREAFRVREGIPTRAPVVLAVSNFYPYKGHLDLAEAAARVVAAVPDVLFLLVGRDAGTLDATRSRARELGIATSVRFAGSRTDVPDLVRAADLFVHPSHEEGFSNAILEAMAGGLPVVACAVGGNPEAVEDGRTGILVPARDPERLAAALKDLLLAPEKRREMGEAGRRRTLERFSLDGMVREMEGLYESLAAGLPMGGGR